MALLSYRSPVYRQRGHGILFHKSPYYIQPGHGIGSFFKSILRFLIPAAKKTVNVGKKILSSSAVKDVMNTVKEEAIKTGVNAAANLIAGQKVAEPFQQDIASSREKIAESVRKMQGGGKRKKKITILHGPKKKRPKDIFDYE